MPGTTFDKRAKTQYNIKKFQGGAQYEKGKTEEKQKGVQKKLQKHSRSSVDDLFKEFNTSYKGLSIVDIDDKIAEYGKNSIEIKPRNTWLHRLKNAFINPFNIVLMLVAVITFVFDVIIATNKDYATFLLIVGTVIISAVISLLQETKLIINLLTKNDWWASLVFAITIAVGLTPEMLPVIMTTTMDKGAVDMSKKKTIVKRISAIQTFGQMNILCTDKTGTLTENEIVLEKYMDVSGKENAKVLKHAFLNSYFQTGLKNLIDVAIIARAGSEKMNVFKEKYVREDEIPFDF